MFQHRKCKAVRTLFNVHSKLLIFLDDVLENVQGKMKGVLYKVRIGSIMYAMVATKVDIAFAVNAVSTMSQFLSKAGPPHCKMHHEVFEGHFGLQAILWK